MVGAQPKMPRAIAFEQLKGTGFSPYIKCSSRTGFYRLRKNSILRHKTCTFTGSVTRARLQPGHKCNKISDGLQPLLIFLSPLSVDSTLFPQHL